MKINIETPIRLEESQVCNTYTVMYQTERNGTLHVKSISGFTEEDFPLIEHLLRLFSDIQRGKENSHTFKEWFSADRHPLIEKFLKRTSQLQNLEWDEGEILKGSSVIYIDSNAEPNFTSFTLPELHTPFVLPLPNSHSVTITTYANDGDDPQSLTIHGFTEKERDLYENLTDLLQTMKDHYLSGRGGSQEYSYVDLHSDFTVWFSRETDSGEDHSLKNRVEQFLLDTNQMHLQTWPEDKDIVDNYYDIESSGFHAEHTLNTVTVTTYDSDMDELLTYL